VPNESSTYDIGLNATDTVSSTYDVIDETAVYTHLRHHFEEGCQFPVFIVSYWNIKGHFSAVQMLTTIDIAVKLETQNHDAKQSRNKF